LVIYSYVRLSWLVFFVRMKSKERWKIENDRHYSAVLWGDCQRTVRWWQRLVIFININIITITIIIIILLLFLLTSIASSSSSSLRLFFFYKSDSVTTLDDIVQARLAVNKNQNKRSLYIIHVPCRHNRSLWMEMGFVVNPGQPEKRTTSNYKTNYRYSSLVKTANKIWQLWNTIDRAAQNSTVLTILKSTQTLMLSISSAGKRMRRLYGNRR